MENIFLYCIRASLVLAIYFGVYKIFFSKNTFYSLNRLVLWSILALTIVLPFVHFQLLPQPKPIILSVPFTTVDNSQLIEAPIATPSPINIETVILILYVVVFLFLLTRYFIGFLQMKKIIQRSKREILDKGTVLCVTDRKVNPFSFLKYIVISNAERGRVDDNILLHEKSHIRLRHSIDKIVFEIFYIFFWFNPFAWLLKRELQSLQEFQADANVIRKGINMQQYQLLLIRKSVSEKNFALANNFLQCDLHKRIKMMKNETNSKRKWSYLLAIPAMVICAFVLSVPKLNAETMPVILDNSSVILTDDNVEIKDNSKNKSQQVLEELMPSDIQSKDKIKINGVVKDENNKKPLVGVTVVVKGTNRGVTTDNKGTFSTEIERGDVLQLMFPEYEVGEIKTNNELSKFDIYLTRSKYNSEDIQKLHGKLTDVSYKDNQKKPLYIVDGIEKKDGIEDLDAKDIESINIYKGGAAIEKYGLPVADGVIIVTIKKAKSNEEPLTIVDGETTVEVYGEKGKKGVTKLVADHKPKIMNSLVVVDGVIKDAGFNLNTISPSEISSMNVIKDEGAIKKYGERAKNGVIEITMKK